MYKEYNMVIKTGLSRVNNSIFVQEMSGADCTTYLMALHTNFEELLAPSVYCKYHFFEGISTFSKCFQTVLFNKPMCIYKQGAL